MKNFYKNKSKYYLNKQFTKYRKPYTNFNKSNNNHIQKEETNKDNLSVSTETTNSDFSDFNNSQQTISINVTKEDIKNAFFVPKNLKKNEYKNNCSQNSSLKNYEGENDIIFETFIKVSKDKTLYLKVNKKENLYHVVRKFCDENYLDIVTRCLLFANIRNAYNYTYALYNLKLNEEEIKYLKELKYKYY